MAVTNNPALKASDQFLLNRVETGGQTFKIPFDALAGNVLNFIIDPDQDGSENSLILIGNLGDVDVTKYIQVRDEATGAPVIVDTLDGNFEEDGTTPLSINSKYWLLQHVDGSVSGASTEGEWVLADPKDAFADVAADIGDALNNLQLNTLLDVQTHVDAEVIPYFVNDTILLAVGTAGATRSGLYQPRRLSNTIENLLQDNKIDINVEDLADVTPIYNVVGDTLDIRLEVTEDFKNGILTAEKYNPIAEAKQFDDILVYVTAGSVVPLAGVPVYDKDGNKISVTSNAGGEVFNLPAGWYYAENLSASSSHFREDQLAKFTEQQEDDAVAVGDELANGDIATIEDATEVDSGVVRILSKMDPTGGSVLEYDATTNKYVLGANYRTNAIKNTNVGITSEGILYSEIPNTLSFVQVIDIVGTVPLSINPTVGGNEYFGRDADGNYVPVPTQGPGSALTPEDWDAATSLPSVGDFYVIRFIPDYIDPDGNLNDPGNINSPAAEQKALTWNDAYPIASPANGPDVIVRNGDIVVFGEEGWSVIGTVSTDTVAQDLQSVTERGFTTDRAIMLLGRRGEGVTNGLTVGRPTNFGPGGGYVSIAFSGVTATDSLFTNHIDFNGIEELPTTGAPLP